MRRVRSVAVIAGTLSLLTATGARAATLAPVGAFDEPMFVTSDPANPDRLFVVERAGVVQVSEQGAVSTFADLSSLVSCCQGEHGLLSIAVAPDFSTSGRFYAAYSGTEAAGGQEGDLHLDAFRHNGGGELVREPILSIGHSSFSNHYGGQLQFGPDGYLYLSTGDGGGFGDPLESGQNLNTLLGKLLRIEPRPGQSPSYAIPTGNPFAGGPGEDEIWAYGLRNPWRFSFDRLTGDLTIADVGQGAREELDRAPSPSPGAVGGAAANYGWSCREGLIAYSGAPLTCAGATGFTDPVFDYPHEDPGDGGAYGCAITGGYVVRDPSLIGDLYGRYVYGDFCRGEIRSIDVSAADPRATDRPEPGLTVPGFSLYSFGEDSSGRVYVLTGSGQVYRVVRDEPSEPAATTTPPQSPVAKPVQGSALPMVLMRAWGLQQGDRRGRAVRITVRVEPCAGNRGRRLLLRRGGKPFAAKRLNDRCLARFHARIRGRSTFRALLPATSTADAARSKRLTFSLPKRSISVGRG